MIKTKVYNLQGEEIKEITLPEGIFGLKKNDELVHQAYVAIRSNKRVAIAHTKTRGDRAGSGIKPWRQKGTGRARVGSVRTPVWRKGGVVFGPRNERNFSKKINLKMKVKAILTVLSGKQMDNEIKFIDAISLPDLKTKLMAQAMKKLEIKGSTLIVYSDKEKGARRAAMNLPKTRNLMVSQLNVMDMLECKNMIMSEESVGYLKNKYAEEKVGAAKNAKTAKTEKSKQK